MVVLKNWLEEFIDVYQYTNIQITDALNSIGFEVESVKTYIPPKNIVIGRIEQKEAHPDAEKLSVCKVNVGEQEALQIVCGASNASVGLTVAVAIDGAVMPSGLKIAKSTLRGVESFGMLCSAEELGYAKTNDGIWELDASFGELIVGSELANLPKFTETVISIDITPNRGDCLSILGMARELAAYFNLNVKKPMATYIDDHEPGIGRALNVHFSQKTNSISTLLVAKVKDFKNSALVNFRLALCELKSQNEYEKACQYTTHATGVLLNVYTASQTDFKENKMELFIAPNESEIDTLRGANELAELGVEQKEFSNSTDEAIILHAFYVYPINVQNVKTPQTKTLYLAKRGSEPELSIGLNYFANSLKTFNGATFYSGVLEFGQMPEPKRIKMDVGLVEDIIGQEFDKNLVVNLLTRLSFKVSTNIEFDNCLVEVPIFRHDIINVHDLAEEVLRLKGLDAIVPKALALISPKADSEALREIAFKKRLRYKSASAGFYETAHFIFTQKSLLQKLGFETLKPELDISNPITAELDTLRTSLLANMLSSCALNVNNSKKRIPLFETGVIFDANRNESFKIAYMFSGESEKGGITNAGKPINVTAPFFINKIACAIGQIELINSAPTTVLWHPYIFADVLINGKKAGILGKIHPSICEEFGLSDTYACELDMDKLVRPTQKAEEFSRFQRVIRDLTLSWPKNIPFSVAKKTSDEVCIKELKSFYAIDWFDANKSSTNANLTLRAEFQSNEKTLSEEEIVSYMEALSAALEKSIKA